MKNEIDNKLPLKTLTIPEDGCCSQDFIAI